MQRPSHWILAFLLLLGAVCALSIWIGGPPRAFALQRAPPAQVAPVRTQLPGPPAQAAPLIGEGFVKLDGGESGAEATVRVLGTDTVVRADGTGRFRAPLPFREVVLVAVLADGSAGRSLVARSDPFTPSRDHGLVPVADLVLHPGATLRGRLRDREGAPIANARLLVHSSTGTSTGTSSQSGAFSFDALLPEPVALEVRDVPGHLGTTFPMVAGTAAESELVLPRAEALRLRVLDEAGAPRAAVVVTSLDADGSEVRGTADRDGYVTLDGALKAPLQLRAASGSGVPLAVVRFDPGAAQLTVR